MSFPTNVKQNSSTKVSRRPGGGWEDNVEEPQLRNAGNVYGDNKIKTQEIQASVKEQPRQIVKPQDNTSLQYENCDEYFLRSHEYENKIVNDVIQPGGARVKQPDSTLHEFCNTCEHIQPNILGSILLSKFDEQIGWISKARVIFAIEALSKKFGKYFDFFKHNTQTLQKVGFTSEGPNANQLRNLMNGLMRVLSHPAFSAELQKENQTFQQKPSAPTLPHNNSQGDSKPKPVSAVLAPTKSASLPEPGQPNRMKYASHIALPTVKDSTSPANANTNATPVNKQVPVQTPVQTENIPKPVVSNTSTPSKPAVENVIPVNNSQSPQLNIPAQQLNIPLSQGNSLMDSLSDVDFSSPNNNLYHLYKAHSPAGNFYGSPSSFGPGYMGGYSPAYYNYPNQVNQVNPVQQGGFNAYVQGQQNVNYQVNSGNNMQYGGFGGHQNVEQGKKEGEDDIFDQATEIDYDREEKEKQKKRQEIEKRFEALNF